MRRFLLALAITAATVVTAAPPSSAADAPRAAVTVGKPTVTSLSVTAGPLGGGTRITVRGKNFKKVRAVRFGTTKATGVRVVNLTTLTVIVPRRAAGTVPVTVTTPKGTSRRTKTYRYAPVPVISAVSPQFGPMTGGRQITLTGKDFTGATEVTVGNAPGTVLRVVSSTKITVNTPPTTSPASVAVQVRTPGGRSSGAASAPRYRYDAAPVISTAPLPQGVPGVAYSATLRTTEARTGTWSWKGTAPSWLSLNPTTGVVTGTPTSAQLGVTPFQVQFTDGQQTTSRALSIRTVRPWTSLSANDYSTCGIKNDGTAWCWGTNIAGMLGNQTNFGTGFANPAPLRVGSATTWSRLYTGQLQTCGVRTDGSAWCWGSNQHGELGTSAGTLDGVPVVEPQQVPGTDWASLAPGIHHTCGVKTDGSAWCWGTREAGVLGIDPDLELENGFTPVPLQVTEAGPWRELSAGYQLTCGVKVDGTAWCWGRNNAGALGTGSTNTNLTAWQPVQVGSGTTWTGIDVNDYSVCASRSDHTAWCWGSNYSGQLATATNYDSDAPNPSPVQIGSATDWQSVSLGGTHACGTKADGSVWCWGRNQRGQVGEPDPTIVLPILVPQPVGTRTDWSLVTAGGEHTCGTTNAGQALCWGWNYDAQLGNPDGVKTNQKNPVPIPVYEDPDTVAGWTTMTAGSNHGCGIRNDASLWCWGQNQQGQVGKTADNTVRSPVRLDLTGWTAVDGGGQNTCGLRSGGTLWCWGTNRYGEAGTTIDVGSSWGRRAPGQVGSATGWAAVSVGANHSCALRSGTAWCWGLNSNGQLGSASNAGSTTPNPNPVQAGPGSTWTRISAGGGHTCGIKTGGTLWCWGSNRYGQLGVATSLGTTATNPTPLQVGADADWASVSAGGAATCAVKSGGTTWCWGYNQYGELGNDQYSDVIPTAALVQVGSATDWKSVELSNTHACGTRTDSSVWCWGLNTSGQLGSPGNWKTSAPNPQPIRVGTGTWTTVVLGNNHTCGVRSGGAGLCWGSNSSGQIGDDATTTDHVPRYVGAALY